MEKQCIDFFDQVSCINLRRSKVRWRGFQRRISLLDWPFRPVQKFNAIDGNKLEPPAWMKIARASSAWGCLVSHMRLVEDALNEDISSILIMEDDVVFCKNFSQKVIRFLDNVPKGWDAIFIGGEHVPNSVPAKVNDYVFRPGAVFRAHCYGMKLKFMRALYRRLIQKGTSRALRKDYEYHIDHHIAEVCRNADLNVFCPPHWLAGQDSGYSYILGKKRFNQPCFFNKRNPCNDLLCATSKLSISEGH